MARARAWHSLVFGPVLVACVFADVLFEGRSLAPSLAGPFLQDAPPAASPFPSAPGRRAAHGSGDLIAGAAMYEAVLRGLAAALREGDSPWWNRWSGCGILGPEVVAFSSSSPLSLLIALGGGGPLAFDLATLLVLALAVSSMHAALRLELGASSLAAAAGATLYALNGFTTSFLATQIVHPYLFAAPALWASLRAARAPGPRAILVAGLAHAALLCATFVPVQLVCLLAVHAVVTLHPRRDVAARRRAWLSQALSLAAGAAAAAWLWLPIADSLLVVDLVGNYQRTRELNAAGWQHVLSYLTPKHYWEAHVGLAPPAARALTSEYDVVSHLGIGFGALACQARLRAPAARGALLVVAVVALRVFGVPPVSWLADLPVVRLVRWQFWGAALGLVVPLLVASGVDRLRAGDGRAAPPALYALAGVGLVTAIGLRAGLPTTALFTVYVGAAVLAFALAFLAVRRLALHDGRGTRWLVLAAALELVVHVNHVRPARVDPLAPPPEAFAPLRSLVGDGRLVSVGWSYVPSPEWGQALRLRTADTMCTSNLPWYRAMMGRGLSLPDGLLWAQASYDRPLVLDRAVLDRLAVRAVVVGAACGRALAAVSAQGLPVAHRDRWRTVFANPTALDRVRVARALAPGDRVRAGDPGDLARTDDAALLARARALGVPTVAEGPAQAARLEVVREANDELVVELELAAPGVLVVSDTWHPGWRASLDGAPTDLARVDEAVRGVLVPAGRHRVAMSYAPRARGPGLALGAVGLLLCVVLARRL